MQWKIDSLLHKWNTIFADIASHSPVRITTLKKDEQAIVTRNKWLKQKRNLKKYKLQIEMTNPMT